MRISAVLVFAVCSLVNAPVLAKGDKPADPDKKICRRYATTGSILGGKVECRTRAEWEKIDQVNNDAAHRTAGRVTLNPAR
jgi:hypothetical protein